jgi:hypothetical protein
MDAPQGVGLQAVHPATPTARGQGAAAVAGGCRAVPMGRRVRVAA